MVGSITNAVLRMSNGCKKDFNGPFEIVSAEGTILVTVYMCILQYPMKKV